MPDSDRPPEDHSLDDTVRMEHSPRPVVPTPQPSGSRYVQDLPLPEELQAMLPAVSYTVEGYLGHGGMGAIYKGLQMPLRRPVAIKILRKGVGAEYAYEERFKREAYAMAALTHPNIVQVYDCGDAGEGFLFISMELVDGGDLSHDIKRGEMTPALALKLIPQICDALEFAHEHGIVHRDIKPANIFVTAGGRAKVADFGLAKHFVSNTSFMTQTGIGMGTPEFAAPEQFEGGRDLDHRADIYSLGVMMYQMLTGSVPRGAWRAPSLRDGVDSRLDDIVLKAMAPERELRYQNIAELKRDIAHITAPISAPATAPRTPAPVVRTPVPTPAPRAVAAPVPIKVPPRKKSTHAAGIIATLATLAVLTVGAWIMLKPKLPAISNPTTSAVTSPAQASMSTLAAARLSPSTEPWQDVLRDSVKLWLEGGSERTPEGLRIPDAGSARLPTGKGPKRDGAVRMLATFGGLRPQLFVRETDTAGVYQLVAKDAKTIKMLCLHRGMPNTTLREFPLREPLQPGQDYELELRVVGQTLTAKFNGEMLGTVTDGTLSQGQFGVAVHDYKGSPALVKALEMLDLDAPSGVSATLASTSYPQPPKWTDATADFRNKYLADGSLATDGEWLKLNDTVDRTFTVGGNLSLRNPILRVLFSENVSLDVRRGRKDGKDTRYSTHIGPYTTINLTSGPTTSRFTNRQRVSTERLDGEHEAVFAAQGDALTLWLDGKLVDTAHDSTLSAGSLAVGLFKSGDGRIKKVEYGDLPDAAPAQTDTTPAAHLSPSTEPWQDVLHDGRKLVLSGKEVERTPEGLRFIDTGTAQIQQGPKRNGAVRLLATFGGLNVQLIARRTDSNDCYQLNTHADGKQIRLDRWDNGAKQSTVLHRFPLREPLQPGQGYELELRIVGQTLTAKLNGEVLGTATDGTIAEGGFGVAVHDRNAAPALVKALEVLDLDAPGAAGAGNPKGAVQEPLTHANSR